MVDPATTLDFSTTLPNGLTPMPEQQQQPSLWRQIFTARQAQIESWSSLKQPRSFITPLQSFIHPIQSVIHPLQLFHSLIVFIPEPHRLLLDFSQSCRADNHVPIIFSLIHASETRHCWPSASSKTPSQSHSKLNRALAHNAFQSAVLETSGFLAVALRSALKQFLGFPLPIFAAGHSLPGQSESTSA